MTHEIKNIIESYFQAKAKSLKTVMATVVALDGSSYRRPGVRMLVREDGKIIGAVSGGCVEKEIILQSSSVFKDNIPKMMTYDGRYRLGCEGILYILIEPFTISKALHEAFNNMLEAREVFTMQSYFEKKNNVSSSYKSVIKFLNGKTFNFYAEGEAGIEKELEVFAQTLKPSLKLIIIGAEHDAVQLCNLASHCGWEIIIVGSVTDPKDLYNFPGAKQIVNVTPETFDVSIVDNQTAVVLMNHSFTKDLQYLLKLSTKKIKYLGILGPSRRREQLFSEITERNLGINLDFFETIHAPSGINIGAETPEEIAISIIAEILAVFRKQEVIPLRDKKGKIHTS